MRARHNAAVRAWEQEVRDIRQHYISLYDGKIGVFEGAGYSAKGLYRSEISDAIPRNSSSFGPVSEEGIMDVIRYLSR